MGENYSYVLLVEGSNKKKLWEYLQEKGTWSRALNSNCLVLPFELDKPITTYIKNRIREERRFYQWGAIALTEQNYPAYITDGKGRIGCLYVDSYKSKTNKGHFITFMAATTEMSRLLQASSSIRKWFIVSSSVVGAVACFLDLEEQGYQLLYPEEGEIIAEDALMKGEGFAYQLLQDYIRVVYGEEYLE